MLVDIEGTTTPITFVYDTLFPYAESRLEEACAKARENKEIAEAIAQLRIAYEKEEQPGRGSLPEFGTGAPYARFLMAEDRKSTGLKMLQGFIWEAGYSAGEIKGEVFSDVPPALEVWRNAGIQLQVFSSGSVLAQKLLFGHTEYGDLTGLFDDFHDTRTGPKKDSHSYLLIAEAFGLVQDAILFLNDVVEELDAAREAGMKTGLMMRPGNKPVPAHTHAVYSSFEDLVLPQ